MARISGSLQTLAELAVGFRCKESPYLQKKDSPQVARPQKLVPPLPDGIQRFKNGNFILFLNETYITPVSECCKVS
jgi:hypothetical protein